MLNKPEDYKWTEEDILREYEELHIENLQQESIVLQ